ncbi:MAG: putative nucleotidyltransferase substrate binding domain-containing protein [Kiloniellales bacterium]
MHSQIRIFSQLVRDFLRPAAVVLPADTPLRSLVGRLATDKASSALMVDEKGRLAGIVTEQDVTRRIAFACEGSEPASALMTRPVETVRADDYLYLAIAKMRRFGWHHMPVVDADGKPCGLLGLHDTLAVAGEQTLRHIERIAHEGSLDGLREIKAAEVALAEDLFRDSVPATEVQAVLTGINRDIHRRVLEGAVKDMADEGLGKPPVAFAAIVMGSGGRGESFLYPDQDNGLVLDDYPDERHGEIDRFFIELAERMTRRLDAVGFPLCKGYVMATNPLWRKTRGQWRQQIAAWGRKRNEAAAQLSDIFFDFRGFYGPATWVESLRETALAMAESSPAFLRALADEATRHPVALGWFGRFVTEREQPEHKGKINLKHAGTLPLVSALRVLALSQGVTEVSTLGRIEVLARKGVLSAAEVAGLTHAVRTLTTLLLRQQLADFRAGRPVGTYLHPRQVTRREREQLVDALKAVGALTRRMRFEFRGKL